jgi:hypothetical protein
MIVPLTQQALGPATQRFLDAVDRYLNSNTLLLALGLERSADGQTALEHVLTTWLRSPLFGTMLLEADRLRGWNNLSAKRIGHFYGQVELRALSPAALVARLWWMLAEGPSPYNQQISRPHALRLLRDFGDELFGAGSWASYAPLEMPVLDETVASHWHVYELSPQQLAPRIQRYFADLNADSVTVLQQGEIVYVLLTNGSD